MEQRHAKRALITGITGQDGSYLAELLLAKGYEVHGHHSAIIIFQHGSDRSYLSGSAHAPSEVDAALWGLDGWFGAARRADEVQAVGDLQSWARNRMCAVSFDMPVYTMQSDALGTIMLLEAVRDLEQGTGYPVKLYQASSSEMFGKVRETPQTENTPFHPRSPYACAKVYSYWQMVNYRESYGMFAVNGILFNHESPRRGETFVTRKVTRAATRIKLGLQDKLFMGNLEAKRDWGFAGDYVEAMWLMLQQEKPEDFVIATGETHSVREWIVECFSQLGLDWKKYVETDPRYLRPAEVDLLLGDSSKAKKLLKWEPKVKFKELAKMMVEADMKLAEREKVLRDHDKSLR